MRRRRSTAAARSVARRARPKALLPLGALVLTLAGTSAQAAPPIRLHVAEDSSCAEARSFPAMLSRRGLVLAGAADEAVDVVVRVSVTPEGAAAELVLRNGDETARRSLVASSCAEALEAILFTLGLALEQPVVAALPLAVPLPTPPKSTEAAAPKNAEAAALPPPRRPERQPIALAWGGGAGAGVFAGASPDAAPSVFVHAEVESRGRGVFAPAAVLGGTFVVPSWNTLASGGRVAFALQTGTLDGCPLRIARGRFELRPCVELQVGRLQARSAGFPGARLDTSPWVALAVALRGRVELGAGFGLTLDLVGGSPLIQEGFSLGETRVFSVGPTIATASLGLAVHFP